MTATVNDEDYEVKRDLSLLRFLHVGAFSSPPPIQSHVCVKQPDEISTRVLTLMLTACYPNLCICFPPLPLASAEHRRTVMFDVNSVLDLSTLR